MFFMLYLVCGIIMALFCLKLELTLNKYESAKDIDEVTVGMAGVSIIIIWPIVAVFIILSMSAYLIGMIGVKVAALMLPPIHKDSKESPYRD